MNWVEHWRGARIELHAAAHAASNEPDLPHVRYRRGSVVRPPGAIAFLLAVWLSLPLANSHTRFGSKPLFH